MSQPQNRDGPPNSARLAADDEKRSEAKIDHAIALALTSSPDVCARLTAHLRWPVDATGGATVIANQRHGEGDGVGETDLRITLSNGGVVLCENKFRATFQPVQGERYNARVQQLLRDGIPRATSVLSATKGYLAEKARTPQARSFARHISIEQWIDWLDEIENPSEGEATALRLLSQVVADWNSGAFQGRKGIWLPAYTRMNELFTASDDGWYIQGNPGDWIHIHHQSCHAAKFHYRNVKREVSLRLRREGVSLSAAAQDDARRRGWPVAGKHSTVVRKAIRIATLGPEDSPSDRDLAEIKRSLDQLLKWWLQYCEGSP